MYDVIIDRIVVSDKVPFSKKCFKYLIAHENDNQNVIPCVSCL